MNRLLQSKEEKNYGSHDVKSLNDDYVFIPFRKAYRKQKTRSYLNKAIDKYFLDQEQKALLDKRIMNDRNMKLKATYDSFMTLTPNERRRTAISAMRGYQFNKLTNRLYSYEDNCVYTARVGDSFNKIIVVMKDHEFSDIEKRNIFDNPYLYTPVSPYRIVFPTAEIHNMDNAALITLEDSMGRIAESVTGLTNSVNTFSNNANNIMQQNAAIVNNLGQRQNEAQQVERQVDDNTYVFYNENGSPVLAINRTTPKVKRGSANYNEKLRLGWIHNTDNTLVFPKPPAATTVNSTINQTIDIGPIITEIRTMNGNMTTILNNMNQFDVMANTGDIIRAFTQIATLLGDMKTNQNQILDKMSEVEAHHLQIEDAKLDNLMNIVRQQLDGTQLAPFVEAAAEVIRGVKDSVKEGVQAGIQGPINNLVNQWIDFSNRTNEHLQRLEGVVDPHNRLDIVPDNPQAPLIEGQLRIIDVVDNIVEQFNILVVNTAQIQQNLIEYSQSQNNNSQQMVAMSTQMYEQIQRIYNSVNTYAPQLENITNAIQNGTAQTLGLIRDTQGLIQDGNNQTRGLIENGNAQTMGLIQNGNAQTQQLIENGTVHTQGLIQDANAQTRGLIENGTAQTQGLLQNGFDQSHQFVNTLGNALLTDNNNTRQLLNNGFINVLTEQAYTQWLMNLGIQNVQALEDNMFRAYQALSNMQPPVTILLKDADNSDVIEVANQVAPVIQQIDPQATPEGTIIPENNLDSIRNDFIALLNILKLFVNNDLFKRNTNEIGFAKFFNAYRLRNYDQSQTLKTFFDKLGSGQISEVELNEGFNYIKNMDAPNQQYNDFVNGVVINFMNSRNQIAQ